MKIFHMLMSREFAGTERHLSELAAWQAQAGDEVHVLLKAQTPEMAARWRAACGDKVVFHFLPKGWPVRLAGVWSYFLAKKVKPDVGHAHLGRAARYMGRGLQWAGVPVVGTLHLKYRDKDAAHLDALIAIAKWQLADVSERYKGMAPRVIWNWARKLSVESCELRVKDTAAPFTFISVGRLVPQKGMDVLVRAFLRAFSSEEAVKLVVVGEGPLRETLQAEDMSKIELVGYVGDVGPYYAAADCFVSAARYEPFGLVILEAMRHGLPLVCTDSEGPAEFLAGVESVVWAKKGDETSLAGALRAAYEAKTGRIDYDMSAFDIDVAGAAVGGVYKDVLQ